MTTEWTDPAEMLLDMKLYVLETGAKVVSADDPKKKLLRFESGKKEWVIELRAAQRFVKQQPDAAIWKYFETREGRRVLAHSCSHPPRWVTREDAIRHHRLVFGSA